MADVPVSGRAWQRGLRLRLLPGVHLLDLGERGWALRRGAWSSDPVAAHAPALDALLEALAAEGDTSEQLAARAGEAGGPLEIPRALYLLGLLRRGCLLAFEVGRPPLARLEPCRPGLDLDAAPPLQAGAWVLSRFAFARRVEDHLALESPRAPARLRLCAPEALALVGRLGAGASLAELEEALPREAAAEILGLLVASGLAVAADASGRTAEETDPTAALWGFHDLLFHARSRGGWPDLPYGKTWPFLEVLPPQPAVRPPWEGPRVPLYRPDSGRLVAADPSLTEALSARRSVRSFGDPPVTVEQLGELLYRAARVVAIHPPQPGAPYETSRRLYPSGGAAYELEIYVAARVCQGLEAGLYHYDPLQHHLIQLREDRSALHLLLERARQAAAMPEPPQVLLCLASRFGRLMWCYEGMAYATTLKNAGALMQTLYLVATAMGLGACALGGGDASVFATATGLDSLAEGAVGEMMIGSLPAPPFPPDSKEPR